jgi:RNA polymerase sigma factor (sigma-70 family)
MDPASSDVGMSMEDAAAAFARFYESELAVQVRAATLLLGSVAAAQDAVHDAFVEVYRRWHRIEVPGPYLHRSVLNRCRDVLRRREVAARHERALLVDDVPAQDAPLFDALARLPFNQRAVVVLRFYVGLGEAEIADQLGCPPGSVGPWTRRALDRLAAELQPQEEER